MALFFITGRDIARIADSPAVIERGLAAFESGSVVSLQALGRAAIIHVEDGSWVRTVEVRFDGAGRPASAGCDCPGDTAGCEHVVAALCALEHEYGGERPAGGTTAGRLPESGQEKGRMGEGLTFEQIERAVPGEALVRAFDLIRAPRRLEVHHFDDQVVRVSVDAGDGTRETAEISDMTRRYGGYGGYGYGAGRAGRAAGRAGRAERVASDPYYVEQHLEFTCTCRGGYMELACPHVAAVLLAAVMRESDRPSLVDHEKRLRKEVNRRRLGSICRELDCAVAEDSAGALPKGLGKADGKGKTRKYRFFFSIEDAHDGGGRVMLLVEKAVVRKDGSFGKVSPATENYLRRFYDGFSDVEKRAIDMLAETLSTGGGGCFRDTSKQMVKVGFSTAVDMELLGRLKELYCRDPGWFPDCSFPEGCGEFLTRVEEKGGGGGGGGRFALRFFLRLGERTFALDGRSCRVFGERHLWAVAADGEEAGRLLFEVACPRAGAALSLAQRSGTEMDAETLRHFVEAYYLKLARLGRVELPEGFDVAELRAEPRPRLYLRDYASVFSIELRFLYGKREISAAEPGDIVLRGEGEMITRIRRDAGAEEKFLALLLGCSVEERGGVLLPSGDPCAWLADAAPELIRGGFEIFGRDTLCNQRVRTGSPFLSIQVRAGADWFDMKGEARFGNEKIALERVARALEERERFIRLSDGSLGVIPREWISKLAGVLGLLRREREEGGEDGEPPGLRASLAQLAIVESLLAVADRSTLDARFKRARKKLESFRGIQNVPLPGRLQGELRDYQKAGYDWLHFLREFSFGGCLADEMGLGKTVQVLSLLLAEKERREREEKRGESRGGPAAPSLVVVPTTLVFNWLAEVEKFAPDLGVYTHHGPGRERDAAAILGKGSDIVITTYGTLRADSDVFGGIDFNYVVLDESQQIKNPLSQVAACARGLKARHRLALTGTPVENNTLDLWSQFAFLNPGLLGGLDYFKRAFAAGIDRDGDADRAAALKNMIKPFILLRRKETVARELPDKQVTTLYCEMSSDQRKVYEGLKEAFRQEIAACIEAKGYGRARMKVLEGLTRLRQVCDHPVLVDGTYEGGSGKLDVLAGRIEEAVGTGHKVLVFSAFVKMLGVLGELFNERGIAHVRLDGSTPAGRRKEVVEAFQRDASVRAFLLSLKAGGFGLNLTAADYVFVVDPWWNPAAEAQAMDRAHRIGQVRSVFVYKAIARDSIEEKVLQLQREKADLFSSIITADDGVFKKLGPEDIRGLFS